MAVDVRAEVLINRPRDDVASYAMDPSNDHVWISGIVEARVLSDPPMSRGTRVERVARFLGKRIEYVLGVVEYDPESLLAMKSVKGPFPMDVSYRFDEAADGTLAQIHVQGEASGFFRLASPMLARAVKRSITKDLKLLKRLLESKEQNQGP